MRFITHRVTKSQEIIASPSRRRLFHRVAQLGCEVFDSVRGAGDEEPVCLRDGADGPNRRVVLTLEHDRDDAHRLHARHALPLIYSRASKKEKNGSETQAGISPPWTLAMKVEERVKAKDRARVR